MSISGKEEAAQGKTQAEAGRIRIETWDRADKAYKEAKKQADVIYKEAKKMAVDKQAKRELDKAHSEALKQAKKVRDAITAESMVAFTAAWEQTTIDYNEAIAKAKEIGIRADKAYEETKKRADMVYKEAKKMAVDKQAKSEADKAHKEALAQAERDYRNATNKSH